MKKTRMIFVGGFLGAGKTTLLQRASAHLAAQGMQVGLITNDQADDLVDTSVLQSSAEGVEEVAGGCFCCRFDDLLGASLRLVREHDPDVLIGEPVGSCTDVWATVLAPLNRRHADRFELAPFTVLVEPSRLAQALGRATGPRFSKNVLYILDKQIEEAEILLLNKADQLAPADLDALRTALENKSRTAPVIPISALNDEGVGDWLAQIGALQATPRILPEVDYDRYAAGEAELGWLNATVSLQGNSAIDGTALANGVLERFRSEAVRLGIEVAHVKLTVSSAGERLHANLVSAHTPAQVVGDALRAPRVDVILNARLPMAPEALRPLALRALEQSAGDGARLTVERIQSLSPARPNPTHRLRPE